MVMLLLSSLDKPVLKVLERVSLSPLIDVASTLKVYGRRRFGGKPVKVTVLPEEPTEFMISMV